MRNTRCISQPRALYSRRIMLTFTEARNKILEAIQPIALERISVASALRRVLASDVVSQEDVPSFDNSSMDGFAVRAAEVKVGDSLTIQREVSAGEIASEALKPRSAIRIFTGAAIPPGTDAVLEVELADEKNGAIVPRQEILPGRNVRKRGEDISPGELVIKEGKRLAAAHLGVLASLGILSVDVYKKPRVALLTTGNELMEIGGPPQPGKIRNSNAYTLSALIAEQNCEPHDLGVARDTEEAIRTKLLEGLAHDALVTSGGVSVGKYDLMLSVAESVGVEILFWKVNIKPGMPFAFGMFERRVPTFFLPGNPVSSTVTFLQLAAPGIEKLSGVAAEPSVQLFALLEHSIKKGDDKRHFSRGVVRSESGSLVVRAASSQSSGVLSAMARSNCFIILPETEREFKSGDVVEIQLL